MKFDTEELHFDIDEKGKPIRCYFKRSKDANKLVEEFMLLANRSVAEMVGKVKKRKESQDAAIPHPRQSGPAEVREPAGILGQIRLQAEVVEHERCHGKGSEHPHG